MPTIKRKNQLSQTYKAASLMNFFTRDIRLVRLDVDTISVTTQYWISLKRRMKTSKFEVICNEKMEKGEFNFNSIP